MKNILTILAILFATSIYSQTNSADSLENSYVTHTDSPDSLDTEMTFEEMEELWAEMERKKKKQAEITNLILYTSGVQQNINQNKQDYRNFYYRKRKHIR